MARGDSLSEGGWGVFLSVLGFAVVGFLFSHWTGETDWGVGVGLYGLACYGVGWALGWGAGSAR